MALRRRPLALRHPILRSAALGLALFATGASRAGAQEPDIEIDRRLPFATRRVIEIALDKPGVDVRTGEAIVAAGDTVGGPLVQMGGRLVLEGTVEGDVTAIDSEVLVRPSAVVRGRMSVLAGALDGSTMATVEGPVVWLPDEPLMVVQAPSGGLLVEYVPPPDPPFPIGLAGSFGLVIHEYNGVDGLAFGIAAALRQRAAWPRTELQGGPVFRTERMEDVGWTVSGLREMPGLGGVVLGAGVYSISDTGQRWHRPDLVNSVAALFVANDGRAYYEREGYEAWAEKGVILPPVTVRARWRDDDFDSLPSQRPFALFAEKGEWPENPAATAGEGRALGAELAWDRRNDMAFTTRGTYAEARYDRWGFGGDFAFDWGQIDLRGWLPIGGESFASLRIMAGGRMGGGDTLAPQFLYRLGGIGTIAGYDGLAPELTGDRMALANFRYQLAVPAPGRVFQKLWLVGLADIGDAWYPEESVEWNTGLGAGLAGRGRTAYLGVVAAYGLESKEWKAYLVIHP